MGLDMYLRKKIYIGANYEHNKVKGQINITKEDKKLNIPLNKVVEIVLEAGYWRKANHIHKWFVDNIQDGEDDCKEYWVSLDSLETLLSLCKETLEYFEGRPFHIEGDQDYRVYEVDEKIEELLPTQSGFFFGGTEYDSWYLQDVVNTIEIIEDCLKSEKEEESGDYYYSSSW